MLKKIKEAKEYINKIDNSKIDVALVLGTGLGGIVSDIEDKKVIKYKDIPNFPQSTVQNHAGELIIGNLCGKRVVVMNGRFHYYEGYTMEEVTFGTRVINSLGVKDIIITNAAGGMNPNFHAGDLMLIIDHINLMGDNPLIGKNYDELGPRFPDMSQAFNKELTDVALKCAEDLKINIQKGVYLAVAGPNFETPAELRMMRKMGGDAVGMSTVPEVIVANHMGMRVLGISCITDMAIADGLEPLDNDRVIATANSVKHNFIAVIKKVIKRM